MTVKIPTDVTDATLVVAKREVRLTNLQKPFWPERGITKGMLIQYYADVAPVLLPHIRDRAMVMKRYPHGASGEFFFMKRAPSPRPPWIEICSIAHGRKPQCRRRSRGRKSTAAFASRISPSRTSRRASRSWAICGSRCCRREGD